MFGGSLNLVSVVCGGWLWLVNWYRMLNGLLKVISMVEMIMGDGILFYFLGLCDVWLVWFVIWWV